MFKLVAVTERKLCPQGLKQQIEFIAQTSVKPQMLILREKDLSAREYLALAEEINAVCQKYQIEFLVHTFWRVCRNIYPDIHLPYPVFSSEDFQRSKNCFRKIGVSVHSRDEAVIAENAGADYVMFGNIYATQCKPGLTGRGITALNEVCQSVRIPVYAVGGIDFKSEQQIAESLAAGACIRSAYMKYNKK